MPKKTRQEKIIAELRRKLQTTGPQTGTTSTVLQQNKSTITTSLPSFTKNQIKLSPTIISRSSNVQDYSYVSKDLRRIVILTFMAVAWEFLLYFILPKLNLLTM